MEYDSGYMPLESNKAENPVPSVAPVLSNIDIPGGVERIVQALSENASGLVKALSVWDFLKLYLIMRLFKVR